MNPYPFSVFKRADRPCFLVSFKNDDGKYLPPLSTKKKTEQEAVQVAFDWLKNGIPGKKKNLNVKDLSIKDIARKIQTGDNAEILLSELEKKGILKSYIRCGTPEAVDFINYMATFWDWETSPYIKEKLRKSHGIHKRHCRQQKNSISLYWEKLFNGRMLGDITADDIDHFISYMGNFELSAGRKNAVIKAGLKPLRWAFSKGHIKQDPTRGHILYVGDEEERMILTPDSVSAIFKVVWKDDRSKIANMLASVTWRRSNDRQYNKLPIMQAPKELTGMRSGEIKALRFEDIGEDCIYVKHSYNSMDKLKTTKNNKKRRVEIPFPELINGLCKLAKNNPWGVTPESYIFWSTKRSKVPMDGRQFVKGLREALVKIGFSEEMAEEYDFHCWRHFFTAYMIGKLDKKLIKGETGHLTDIMVNHYANHFIDGDRELIQEKKRETFAGLLPERSNVIAFYNQPLAIAG